MARTTSADFRKLTPMVLARALEQAGTYVCEPMLRLSIELPSERIRGLLNAIAQSGGLIEQTWVRRAFSTVEATMPAGRARDLQRQLPGLTGGEGNVESIFDGYQPVRGTPPKRASNPASSSPSP
jgi:ribosomal protection tetracycline resistance protein